MPTVLDVSELSTLGEESLGVFRGRDAVTAGVSRNQIGALVAAGTLDRMHPDTYRMTVVPRSSEQSLRAALVWAGPDAVAFGCSAGATYELEGVVALVPEIVVPMRLRPRSSTVVVHRSDNRAALMTRLWRGIPVTGIEATLVSLAHALDGEAFEIAFEDARRRRLTTVPAVRAYLTRFARTGRPGVASIRRMLDDLDPTSAARSTLEVQTRRLLTAHGITDFVREFPLQ